MYQHKDLSNENLNEDEDLESKKINNDDNSEDSVIESESEPQHRTESSNDNPESVEVESISRKHELTTDEILELYKNVEINEDELISADDIIKMYETDAHESETVNDHKNIKEETAFKENKVDTNKKT